MLINTLHDLAILAALEANASMCAAKMQTSKGFTPTVDELDEIAFTAWASAKCLVDAMHPGIRKTISDAE